MVSPHMVDFRHVLSREAQSILRIAATLLFQKSRHLSRSGRVTPSRIDQYT